VVRAFGREAAFAARFRWALRAALAAFNRATKYASFYPPVMATLAATSIAVLLWVGAAGAAAAWGVTLGVLTAFVLLFQRFFEPVIALGDDWQTVQAALAGIERITQALALPAEEAPPAAGPEPARAAIELTDISFGYLPERPVLHGVSLVVRSGEQVALVGRTGAGKSSALHLLGGLYAPWSGRVRVTGRDPRALAPAERRTVVGVVPQAVQLFGGSVLDNLTLGDPSVPRAAAERAAIIAGADAFIRALPEGYDTALRGTGQGEGVQLSAGQQQLLALARALVWEPAVVLLDEATAAIDAATEATLREALRSDELRGRHAVLTVAHRLSTARAADRVIVLEAGRIVEAGPPEELIGRGGRFAALVELEAAGWDWRAVTPGEA
jgi:ATP-binding cassette subfamily B protein